ncbi:MAG: hypothetical protein OXG44_16535 [Gammaproteobacteria bacterium]|nr:hypothetical protein [Gammaproteobacteria bacterium]
MKTTRLSIVMLALGVLMAGCQATSTPVPKDPLKELGSSATKIDAEIKTCKETPTAQCRDDVLVKSMAHYDIEFLNRRAKLLGPRHQSIGKGLELLDSTSDIVLPNLGGASEQEKIPIGMSLLGAIKSLFFQGGTARTKAAQMEADLLRLRSLIEDRFGTELGKYRLEDALVDLKRYEQAAVGTDYQ